MIENLVEISAAQLLDVAQRMMYEEYRFITATCVDNGDSTIDIFYHFDREYELKNYMIRTSIDTEIPSISKVYYCAVFVENEMKELFGLNIKDIILDYEGHMLLSDGALENPMSSQHIIAGKQRREGDA